MDFNSSAAAQLPGCGSLPGLAAYLIVLLPAEVIRREIGRDLCQVQQLCLTELQLLISVRGVNVDVTLEARRQQRLLSQVNETAWCSGLPQLD